MSDHGRVATIALKMMRIGDVRVGERHRKDQGNIDGLAASIAELGLMHPIVVRQDGTLIAGERRLRAVESLGWTGIPVSVVDIDSVVRGEFAENTCRKDFTPSELVAIGQELEYIEKARAKTRMVAAHASPGKLPEQDKGDARDKIAKQLGVSGRTYEKARDVVEAATAEPERFGILVDEMDRTGKVTGAHRKLLKARDEQRILGLVPIVGKFRTIVIDPAWDYDWLSLAGRAAGGYAKMTLEELGRLDVRAWADESTGCHLYCCVTNNFSYEGHKLVERWGFQHRQVISWIKPPPFGLGSYFRNSTELVLFATLGETTTRPAASSIPTHFEAPRGEHSEKPEKFYEIVRSASYAPYGEAFQRKPRPDFVNLFRETEQCGEVDFAGADADAQVDAQVETSPPSRRAAS